ncbi:hypothetical protein HF521_007534 [Silurus meridionalis]|uniref:Uncharacterized protein n=1 Tax=Silurus meridionalis TaxID=175797 RepID=A0A8T0AP48_SILME|nr:hypothetical protein HF521_007534 [Silurus meridionalis]
MVVLAGGLFGLNKGLVDLAVTWRFWSKPLVLVVLELLPEGFVVSDAGLMGLAEGPGSKSHEDVVWAHFRILVDLLLDQELHTLGLSRAKLDELVEDLVDLPGGGLLSFTVDLVDLAAALWLLLLS